jgi:phage terminase small subunit
MPTPLKTTGNIRKHLSKAERQARQAAEGNQRGPKRVTLKAPEWLSEEARKIFDHTKRRLHGVDILDSVDADLLALYSGALARYQALASSMNDQVGVKMITAAQAWSRLALGYGEKLGITPTGRARLAKKKTEERQLDDMELLFSEVNESLNGQEGHA